MSDEPTRDWRWLYKSIDKAKLNNIHFKIVITGK